MKPGPPSLSRRGFLAHFVPGRSTAATETKVAIKPEEPPDTETPTVAVIAGRFCLAYQGSFCSVCHERCPETGAIVTERGLPRVIADLCTGCRVCHDVCPAPTNAVLLVPRPSASGHPDLLD